MENRLRSFNLGKGRLVFEITETVAVRDLNCAQEWMKRLMRLRTVLTMLAVTIVAGGCATVRHDPRPNVLFILADDAGYGDLGCECRKCAARAVN